MGSDYITDLERRISKLEEKRRKPGSHDMKNDIDESLSRLREEYNNLIGKDYNQKSQ